MIYEKLLSDKLSVDLGYVYENIVAQMLVASGHKLFYHTWRSETSNHNYKVDFLLSKGTKIRPIEVKSSGYKTHKSLDEFCRKYSGNVSDRYLPLYQGPAQGRTDSPSSSHALYVLVILRGDSRHIVATESIRNHIAVRDA